jgi:tetratricopeptide (TPR) repeat protein
MAYHLAAGPVVVVPARGLGGAGKSQLALEYAHRARESGRYRITGWVRADSPVKMAEDLAALAPQLSLPAGGPAGEVAAQVILALKATRDWLVVFDNAQRTEDLEAMLPARGGHVLITSRSKGWDGLATQLDLDVFGRLESMAFLYGRTGRSEPLAAWELAAELRDLPLALALAAAYIDSHGITIRDYLGLCRDPAVAHWLRIAGLESAEYPDSVARTWLLHFDQLQRQRPAALELLRLCGFLDPDAIDLDLLAAGASMASEILAAALADPLIRAEAARTLTRTGLATALGEGRLQVHRLVQAVTRDELGHDAVWARRAVGLIAAAFPDHPDDHRSWPVCGRLAAHIEAVVTAAEPYPDLVEASGRLLSDLGIYLKVSGQLMAARAAVERALGITEDAYGPDQPEVAATLTNLSIVLRELGELAGARAAVERALSIAEDAYGPDHPEVAAPLTNLGIVLRELGELAAARAAVERALGIVEDAYGPDHPEVAATLGNLGIVRWALGEVPAARAAVERALGIYEAAYGPEHPSTRKTRSALRSISPSRNKSARQRHRFGVGKQLGKHHAQ